LERERAHFQRELERYQAAVDVEMIHPATVAQLRAQVAEIEGQLRLAEAELQIVQRELETRAMRR
jgi:outer membrane protein TolC